MEDRSLDKAILWSPQYAFEVALGFESSEVLAEKFGLSSEEHDIIQQNPLFIKECAEHTKVIKEQGITLATKAQISLETMLPKLVRLFSDETIPAASRIAAFDKVANLANIKDKGDDTPTLSFNFAFSRDGQPKLVKEED